MRPPARPRPEEPIRLVGTKQGGSRYRVTVDVGARADGRRRQVTSTHTSLGAARASVDATRAAVRGGTYLGRDKTTVSALCDAWLTSKRDVRPVTANAYRNVLVAVRRRIGHLRIQDVRRSDVEALVTWATAEGSRGGLPLSHRTVCLMLGTFKQLCAYAVAEGLVASSPRDGQAAPQDTGGHPAGCHLDARRVGRVRPAGRR